MKVAFRCDASLQMGTGHVMRCLTLANALAAKGAACTFLCREHPGHLLGLIQRHGHAVHVLAGAHGTHVQTAADHGGPDLKHAAWLGTSQQQDWQDCQPHVQSMEPDWLVVDHYAIDTRWEQAAKALGGRLMVIDDLADRAHECDLLLDQTFGRIPLAYACWTPSSCQLLCGAKYALLRPEFAALRDASLARRAPSSPKQVLVSMGGVDLDNATGLTLNALQTSQLPRDCQVTVVMGANAPWVDTIKRQAARLTYPCTVKTDVRDMATLMANADLAIGAAGATSWERCCLGLPSIMVILADNQRQAARALTQAHATLCLDMGDDFVEQLRETINRLVDDPDLLHGLGIEAARIVDGKGCDRVVATMSQHLHH